MKPKNQSNYIRNDLITPEDKPFEKSFFDKTGQKVTNATKFATLAMAISLGANAKNLDQDVEQSLDSLKKTDTTLFVNEADTQKTSIKSPFSLEPKTELLVADASNLLKTTLNPHGESKNYKLLSLNDKIGMLKKGLENSRDASEVVPKLGRLSDEEVKDVLRIFSKTLDLNPGAKRIEKKALIIAKLMINLFYSIKVENGKPMKYLRVLDRLSNTKRIIVPEELTKNMKPLTALAQIKEKLNIDLAEGKRISYEEIIEKVKKIKAEQDKKIAEQNKIKAEQRKTLAEQNKKIAEQ
ncbi:hypothetical protein CSA08_04690, partial [Candidatus Gracilibacteria bacterium]